MQTSPRYGRTSQPHHLLTPSKQRRSGYEPSDTETDFQESPWRDHNPRNRELDSEEPRLDFALPRTISPLKTNRRHSLRFEYVESSQIKNSSETSTRRRHSSKSPYKTRREDGNNLYNGNISPLSKSPIGTYHSPHKEEHNLDTYDFVYSNRRQNDRALAQPPLVEVSRVSRKPNYTMSKRTVSAPRMRPREKDQENKHDQMSKPERTPSPLPKAMAQKLIREVPKPKVGPSSGEINERVAYAKLARDQTRIGTVNFESTESISPGDIFFSREWTVLALPKKGGLESQFSSKPNILSQRDSSSNPRSRANGNLDPNKESASGRLSQTGSSSTSRAGSVRFSTESSKLSDASGRTTESMKKFTDGRRKSQKEAWFNCVMKGPCRSTKKSPERTARTTFNEALYIEKAVVVEKLRQFWADKYQPGSLNGFTFHKQEAQLLKQLVSNLVSIFIDVVADT